MNGNNKNLVILEGLNLIEAYSLDEKILDRNINFILLNSKNIFIEFEKLFDINEKVRIIIETVKNTKIILAITLVIITLLNIVLILYNLFKYFE